MTKREKNLIFFVILLLIVFGMYTIISNFGNQLNALETDNEILQEQKTEIDTKLELIESLNSALENNKIDLLKLKKDIQDNVTDEQTDTIFTNLAVKNGLIINSLSVANGDSFVQNAEFDTSNMQMKQVVINGEATSEEMTNFVNNINLRNDILITNFSQNIGMYELNYQITCVLFMEKSDAEK